MLKRAAFVALSGVLALACGGGGGGGTSFKDPDSVNFTFPDGSTPAVGSPEESAAASASSDIEAMLAVPDAADADVPNMVGSIAGMPEKLSGLFPDGISPDNMGQSTQTSMSRRAAAYLVGDTAAAIDGFPEACIAVSPGTIVFTNCTMTETQDGVTITQTVNGSFHREAGHVSWDATMGLTMSGTVDGEASSFGFSYHMSGDVTFGDGAIQGFERADLSVRASQGSMNAAAALTYNVDIDVQYQTGPFCITDGTLTVKLIWSEKPHGSGLPPEAANVSDAAVQFTWVGCNSVNVAWGTLP